MASPKDGSAGCEDEDGIGEASSASSLPMVILPSPSPSPNRTSCLTPTLCVQGPGGGGGGGGGSPHPSPLLSLRRSAECPTSSSHTLSPRRGGDGAAANNSLSPTGSINNNTNTNTNNNTNNNNNPVHRSFSDLPSHHSAAGSDVSSETSRASAGASLEKFFTQMGMERDVLDPLLQIQQQQQQHQQQQQQQQQHHHNDVAARSGSREAVFESISSLDSYDARSLCSAVSRSEKDLISDTESTERNQQQATLVERNARIIKWLSNVKKAKTPAASATVHSSSSNSASS